MKTCTKLRSSARRGGALLLALIAVVVVAAFAGAILATSTASKQEGRTALERTRALYAAEAGVSDVLFALRSGDLAALPDENAARAFAGGTYWGSVVDDGDGRYTITSIGDYGTTRRALEAVVEHSGGGIFQNAIFAGNSSGDPAYTLELGGEEKQADAVTGNVYSGRNIEIRGDATVNGVVRATGDVAAEPENIVADKDEVPAPPEEGVEQPIPDLAGMNYAVENDVDVVLEFGAAKYESAAAGGKAWQLPEENPAHIFRLNPSDRSANWGATEKNDFFLEDPYAPLRTDPKEDGKDCYQLQLSDGKKGGADGNHKVYYVDGNLWIHNRDVYSFQFKHSESNGIQVTFVVKGNVYISDNLYYQNKKKDGVAFIAMKDDAVEDSGNVYFGDPTFGTLKHMDAFLYAENNFYDNNLDALGSAEVTLRGNMTAGNHVAIERDFGDQHSRLAVEFDDRVATNAIDMPGLPSQSGSEPAFTVLLQREIALP